TSNARSNKNFSRTNTYTPIFNNMPSVEFCTSFADPPFNDTTQRWQMF
ncbi:19988_t:CDS:1, partial [Gigaspora rosea]